MCIFEESDIAGFLKVKNSVPPDFKAKGDLYVFVDECHRTQSGELHDTMKQILPYEKVRSEVKMASGDYIDLKVYEPAMRHLIDNYIRAEESNMK